MVSPGRTVERMGAILSVVLGLSVFTSCGTGDNGASSSTSTSSSPAAGTAVQVSVSATDPDGDQLHYRWAATEGTIINVDASKTTWVVPAGSGLQFAYVVVSDNKGGYTESRAAVLTFDQPAVTPAANITPPSLGGSPGFAWGSVFYKPASFGRNVYLPGVTVTLSNGRSAITDPKGQFFISNVLDGTYTATITIPGNIGPAPTASIFVSSSFPSTSLTNYQSLQVNLPNTLNVAGSVRLADQSYCGIRNEFFTKVDSSDPNLFTGPISGTAQLFTAANAPLSSPFPINHYGDFLIVRSAVTPGIQAKVRISCENGPAQDSATISLPASGPAKVLLISFPNRRPTISTMTVLLNGRDVGRPDLPKPRTLFTSLNNTPPIFGDPDLIAEIIHTPGDDAFLTYKGLDTRNSACAYYRAIGAVAGCDANGFPTGAQLTLDQWRSKFNLSPFSTGNPANPPASDGQETRILYINKSDLNFARDMQAVKLTNGDIAYNVCNYPGPQDVTDPLGTPKEIGTETQPDIDLAIENTRRGIGMVVCVAMDYSAIPGINGGQPFTKFYTFGPTGKLLLSVSLDGRREKFMPGSCTACHGGDLYGGRFPDDGSGRPDLKSHWQPFDMANFQFSSSQDLAVANAAMKTLNQRMVGPGLDPMTTPRTRELISGWYAGGRLDQNSNFIPSQLTFLNPSNPSPTQLDLYRTIIQPMCQTCHAAQRQTVTENITDKTKVCGESNILEQNHVMTNALVPFERFWIDPTLSPKLNLGCNIRPLRHPAL